MRNALRFLLILALLILPATVTATPSFAPQLDPFTDIELAPIPQHAVYAPVTHRTVIPKHRARRARSHRVTVHAHVKPAGKRVRLIEATDDSVQCLALAIYYEARGETTTGQAGVGYVVMNRVHNRHFKPKTVCGVIKQPYQFSWVRHPPKGMIHAKAYTRATVIARQVLAGSIANPVGDSLYFHERRSTRGSPSRYAPHRIALGNHVFFGPTPTRALLAAR